MTETPRGNRVHIAIFGKTNAGKSTLINGITGQKVSLVSDIRGTTTDPVYKSMELLPIGPVVFIDTAGIDDNTQIGNLRIEKTMEILNKMDMALMVVSAQDILEDTLNLEKEWIEKIKNRNKPCMLIINKADLIEGKKSFHSRLEELEKQWKIKISLVSSLRKEDMQRIKTEIAKLEPELGKDPVLIGDKIYSGDRVLLVAPQDLQAPKGRLILPQVQVIRDILDHGGIPSIVTLENLEKGLNIFNGKPDLVITDSQIFKSVDRVVDKDVLLTSFSIIMARAKGDLDIFYQGAKFIEKLKDGDRVLIAEACTHHQMKGDIAREKIPMLLQKKVPGIIIENCSGKDFPEDLSQFKLVIHCGSCMFNRSETMSRVTNCLEKNLYITNFGMAIAQLNGILDRVTAIFKIKL
ncbi:[FeFe] hydrogenase H-cluster maturation GTPase HydF [Fusobacterium sp.]|uniref:[FeFe] hydrogenase H-cluster maturation GTPase HydF n=1 Tax=Fusobacterium sp. TaxID=68766 RepID=UPI00396C3EE3